MDSSLGIIESPKIPILKIGIKKKEKASDQLKYQWPEAFNVKPGNFMLACLHQARNQQELRK